jgi:hypothetical protein
LKAQRRKVKQHKTVAVGYNPPRPFYKKQIMQIVVKVDTGYLCNWRDIEPLQPEGFKGQTANEKETLKNSIVKNGFHDAFDVWQHEGKLLSIDGVHRKIALLELAEEGYEIPEQLPCTYVTAENETEAATIILSRNAQHSHILSAAVMTAAFKIPAAMIEAVVPQKNLDRWNGKEDTPSYDNLGDSDEQPDIDYSILDEDDDGIDQQLDDMAAGVKKAIQIEFEAEHYEEAYALVKFWREKELYIGGFLMEQLKAEKEKL